MQFPILSVIVFTPILSALVILLIPGDRKNEIRVTALAAALVAFLLSIWVYFSYDTAAAGYQFVEKYTWLPALGISYHVGIDGISAPLVLLTGLVMFTGVLISWGIDDRPREFFAFLFILATGVIGVFVALDLFMLFFFYEIAVFPMYLLIAIWGWKQTREYAAMKLTLYLFIGSVVALVGALAMFFAAGMNTFDMLELEQAGFSLAFQQFWFPFVFLGFAVLGGIFPFHNWSPDGHVAAPTAVSMFHAGVLMKLGAFAALRVGIMLLPEGAKTHMWWIILLALVNVVYGAFIASVQTDFKYVIGFSSVSHMGLVMMGFATLTRRPDRRRRADVLARGDDSPLLCCRRHGLRPGAHTRHTQTGRRVEDHALRHGGLHHRRPGVDGHARLFRFRGRIPHLHGGLANRTVDCNGGGYLHRNHRRVYHPHYPQCIFWLGARRSGRAPA